MYYKKSNAKKKKREREKTSLTYGLTAAKCVVVLFACVGRQAGRFAPGETAGTHDNTCVFPFFKFHFLLLKKKKRKHREEKNTNTHTHVLVNLIYICCVFVCQDKVL